MRIFTILLVKILSFIGEKIGRGSSLPGAIALKFDKKALSRIKMPKTVIAVTGSNGKTTLCEMLRAAARQTGLRVIGNSEGSNQIEGVTTVLLRNCNLKGEVQADIAILESDERFCQYTFSHFTPDYIVVGNLFRDQLTRNGHSEFVKGEMLKGLPAGSTLILNADEPMSASLAAGRDNVLWYGVEPAAFCEAEDAVHAYDDGARCPLCHGKMSYTHRIHDHLGAYQCAACGFKRQTPNHAVTDVADGAFLVDGTTPILPQIKNTMFAYNIAAACTAAVEVLGLSLEKVAEALSGYHLTNARIRTFELAGHKGTFLLSKHENSMSYNGSLNTVVNAEADGVTVVLIVDLLSRKYVANDMSWLWDVDFHLLAADKVKRVVISGGFANDVAARLLLGGVQQEKLTVEPDLDKMMDAIRATAEGDIYVMTCFTDVNKFTSRL